MAKINLVDHIKAAILFYVRNQLKVVRSLSVVSFMKFSDGLSSLSASYGIICLILNCYPCTERNSIDLKYVMHVKRDAWNNYKLINFLNFRRRYNFLSATITQNLVDRRNIIILKMCLIKSNCIRVKFDCK